MIAEVSKRNRVSLEQLRQMDGEPIWVEVIVESCIEDGYALVDVYDRRCVNEKNEIFYFEEYGKTWLAYAYPPAHIGRSEWTAEWIYPENEWNLPRCSKCGCNSKDATYGHKNNFCPKCGRAMTPEAWAELERRLRMPEPPEEG